MLERPSIEEFTIEGNDEIKTEDLEESLRQVGLTRGKVFDRSVLEEVQQFLYEQYYSRGRYGVSVETPIEDIGDNRVRVGIEIEEGARSKIRQINVVGNTSFTDGEILGDFELSTGNWLSFIRNDDRYSKEALEGDRRLFAVAQNENQDDPDPQILYAVGTVVRIIQTHRVRGGIQLLVRERKLLGGAFPTTVLGHSRIPSCSMSRTSGRSWTRQRS